MTNRNPSENTISRDEMSSAFAQAYAPTVGYLTFEKLRLEQAVQALQSHITNIEAAIASLKIENSNLIKNQIMLESEIARLIEIGPTVGQISAQERAKAEARKDKAAP